MKLFSQYNRFELEQDIIKLWDTNDLIQELIRQHLDREEGAFSEDELANRLQGIMYANDLRIQRIWDGFEVMLKNEQFVPVFAVPNTEIKIKKGKKK